MLSGYHNCVLNSELVYNSYFGVIAKNVAGNSIE